MYEQSEHSIQNDIRDFLQYLPGQFWRINVGAGWIGKYSRHGNTISIQNARWFSTGVPKGFPDLIGILPHIIKSEDVGKLFGRFAFIEVKRGDGKASNAQMQMHDILKSNGGIGGIARSIDDVQSLFGGGNGVYN